MKEAIEKLKIVLEMIECPHKEDVDSCGFCKRTSLLNQVLAILTEQPKCKTCGGSGKVGVICTDNRQDFMVPEISKEAIPCPDCKPNCKGCEHFKHTHSNEHCYRYTEEPSLCKLRQPVEQLSVSELAKEAIELDKMCVSEIVAKYESSHNAITVLKRKFREACESDEWMKSATEFYENGGCPICFSTDEAGCTEGCYLGQLQAKLKEQPPAGEPISLERQNEILFEANRNIKVRLDRSEAGERILEERIEKLSDTLDRSEAENKKLRHYGDYHNKTRKRTLENKRHLEALYRIRGGELDRSEASRKELLTALEMCERARACGQIEKIDKIILQAAIKEGD